MSPKFAPLAILVLFNVVGASVGQAVTAEEKCVAALANYKVASDAFAIFENAKDRAGRYPPVEKPPAYHWACRGAESYQDRDEQQDADFRRYVDGCRQPPCAEMDKSEGIFLKKERESAFQLAEAARSVLACGSKRLGESSRVQDRVGSYYRARIASAIRDAMKMPGPEKYERLWPLMGAILSLDRQSQLLSDPGAVDLMVIPLAEAHLAEVERLVREQHDLRFTPEILMKLHRNVAVLTGQMQSEDAHPLNAIKRLWRFEVDVRNTFTFREGEDEVGNVTIESALQNHVMALEVEKRTIGIPVHFEPNNVHFKNVRVEYEHAQFVGPPSFPTIIDLGFDPCGKSPAAYFAITDLGSEFDNLRDLGGEDPPSEEESPAYYLAPGVMEAKREPIQWNGLPGLVFKVQFQGQNAEVVNETISQTQRRAEDGAMLSNELRVAVRHAPLSAASK